MNVFLGGNEPKCQCRSQGLSNLDCLETEYGEYIFYYNRCEFSCLFEGLLIMIMLVNLPVLTYCIRMLANIHVYLHMFTHTCIITLVVH